MRATYSKTITEADIVLFAGVSGDNNALHLSEEFAATTRFGGLIAHGFLTASVISAAVANRLPGKGTICLSQPLNFRAPVRPGQTVHACVCVSTRHRVPGWRDGGDRRLGAGDDHLVGQTHCRSDRIDRRQRCGCTHRHRRHP